MAHNGLPTGVNLCIWGVQVNNCCLFCGFKNEDIMHLFFSCWWAKVLWNRLGITFPVLEITGYSKEWFWDLFELHNISNVRKIMVTLWAIWTNRNIILHENTGWSLDQCVFKITNTLQQHGKKRLVGYQNTYSAEVYNQYKIVIYCDGAWSYSNKQGGCSVVVMQNDTIIHCSAKFLKVCNSVLEAEVYDLVLGMRLASTII